MSPLFELIIAVAIVGGLILFFHKGSSVSNVIRAAGDGINKAVSDPSRDSSYAISDSKEEVQAFNKQIADLMASNRGSHEKLASAQAEVSKWEKLAQNAGNANDADGVKEALGYKAVAQAKVANFGAEIEKNEQLIATLRKQSEQYQDKIQNSENQRERDLLTLQSSKLREKVATGATGLGSHGGLAALDSLHEKSEQARLHAESMEELAGSTPEGKQAALLAKYDGNQSVADDEVAKYLKKPASSN